MRPRGLGRPYQRGSLCPWVFNMLSGATAVTCETWGGVKARYRQSAPAAPQGKWATSRGNR
jgi:hypothetical protein